MRNKRKDRTSSKPKNVPDSSGQHIFPAELLKILNGRLPLPSSPKLEGDLSSWILGLYDLAPFRSEGENPAQLKQQVTKVLSVLNEFARSRTGEGRRSGVFQRIHEVSDLSEIWEAVGFPTDLGVCFALSAADLARVARALRASFRCIALYRQHPVVLISHASSGDRRAVLDLIKIDKMFLSDQCCRESIRKAALEDDRRFLGQVQRAVKYKVRLRRRDLLHLYLFVLLLCEQSGVEIPQLRELLMNLDSSGREYDSLAAFEKDVRRRKRAFTKMMEETAPLVRPSANASDEGTK